MHCPGDVPQPNDDLKVSEEVAASASLQYDRQELTHTGYIQAHGVLVVVDPESMAVRAVSENAPNMFEDTCEHLLQKSLPELLPPEDLEQIHQWAENAAPARRSLELVFKPLSLSIHGSSIGWILEFEAFQTPSSQRISIDTLRSSLTQIRSAQTLQTLLALAVEQCCHLTGFERVMAYRFDAQGAGEVLAEVKPEDAIAYLGLHFPATDIPEQVRQMYRDGPLRYVPNLEAPFQALRTDATELSPDEIDLSQCLLRSVDHCCVTYHRNMGVRALMVLPLCIDQELWGLIALHHSQPLPLSLQQRDLMDLIGQAVSLALSKTIKAESLDYESDLKQLQSDLIQALSEAEKFEEVLIQPNLQLMDLVQADGVALCLTKGITLIGETPDGGAVLELLNWAQARVSDFVYVTHQLPLQYEPAHQYRDKASGVLLLRISEQQNISILWFRKEQKQHITWAGNPAHPFSNDTDGELGPRQSFEHWQELVQCTSRPWLASEIENALGLRAAISGIALRRADELTRINQELERSNEELASFAYAASHDLKEPLRGIYNYTTFLIEDYADQLDDAGLERMQALLKLTKRMEQLIDALLKFAQMRQAKFSLREVDLQQLVESVVDVLRISRGETSFDICYPRPLPVVESDPLLIRELFANLLSNAIKYNNSDSKVIEIGYLTPEEQAYTSKLPLIKRPNRTIFYVRDNGIGIKSHHHKTIFRLFKRLHARDRYGGGTGAGLTIVKKIIERHGGDIGVESTPGKGTTFWFSLA